MSSKVAIKIESEPAKSTAKPVVNFRRKLLATNSSNAVKEPRKVIVDLDAGTNDAMALLMLLAADSRSDIRLLGVTCVHGNTTVDNVCINVLRVLGTVGRFDVLVYRGAEEGLIQATPQTNHQFHGADGFGEVKFPHTPNLKLLQPEHAVVALNKITSYPNHHKGMGNTTSAAEFNFHSDPEAAFIVLNRAQCPITILPWETCVNTKITFDWRFQVLGGIHNPHMDLMNAIERSVYEKANLSHWMPCDALLSAVVLYAQVTTKCHSCHMTVELHGHFTRGQAIVDHLEENEPNVTVVDQLDVELFKRLLIEAVSM
uniref:Inosine/uridine-preferring nucleoside hydrolase domain-containing protein n=1 Tax=Timema cristinae TaxID=61476 RepID=A0A7R9CTG1_TIMCR|nr:unnamed protein product [Timema cristinae]